MGAGFSRLNSLTIVQTSQGLAEHLLHTDPQASTAGVVIGHDARHNSEKLARVAASVFISKNIKVYMLDELSLTPLVPFSVNFLRASAGIMITASHNPAMDNGYKVYGSNGCQIVSPVDKAIAASISANLDPTPHSPWDYSSESLTIKSVFERMNREYLSVLQGFLSNSSYTMISFVYTPLHGVGLRFMQELLGILPNSGPNPLVVVEEQAQPDPDFPTVKYPNPEETGALDLAKSCADRHNIQLILANDPDADRFAAAEKVDGHWIQFTGDQVGILLAHFIFSKLPQRADTKDVMLVSAVSSSTLSHMAAEEGFTVEETLTGFKWLGNRALDLEGQGKRVHFAYEEALGYMFPSVVHDKDGIAAAGVFLNACAEWKSPWSRLQDLYRRYGYFETMNTYWRSPDAATTSRVFEELKARGHKDRDVAERLVTRWRDLSSGYDSGLDDNKAALPSSPETMMLTCWLAGSESSDGARFTVRASGTEPKIKCKTPPPFL